MAISPALEQHYRSLGIDPATAQYTPSNTQLQQPDYGVLGALGGLYGAYSMGNNVSQGLGQSNAAIDQQIGSLQDMYNPNGAVATQMGREMAAKDAAAGRNSQYMNRSVALQAALAKGASQNAQTIGSLVNQKNQGNIAQQQVQAQQLASLFNLGDKSGLLGKANQGLSGLYSQYFPSASSPTYQSNGGMGQMYGPDTPDVSQYQSNQGMGQMYGPDTSNYAPGMDTSQSPTSSNNAYSMDDYLKQ
jgi:hypothetical protein